MEAGTISNVHHQFDYGSYAMRRFSAPRGIIDEERGVQPFYLQSYHEFYHRFSSEWDTGIARLLELGGGPVIYPLISASPYVSEIVFTDFIEGNREQVRLWKSKAPGAHDWSPYFKYVVNTLEGATDPAAATRREEELQNKIKDILHCDICAEQPRDIISGGAAELELFDVVSFNFCCEAVFDSHDAYKEGLKKVGALVRPKGFLTSLVSEEESYYTDGSKSIPHLFLTAQDIHEYYKQAGFSVRYSARFPIPEAAQGILNDCKAIHFIAVQKT